MSDFKAAMLYISIFSSKSSLQQSKAGMATELLSGSLHVSQAKKQKKVFQNESLQKYREKHKGNSRKRGEPL
jgi:hypothetical protein